MVDYKDGRHANQVYYQFKVFREQDKTSDSFFNIHICHGVIESIMAAVVKTVHVTFR